MDGSSPFPSPCTNSSVSRRARMPSSLPSVDSRTCQFCCHCSFWSQRSWFSNRGGWADLDDGKAKTTRHSGLESTRWNISGGVEVAGSSPYQFLPTFEGREEWSALQRGMRWGCITTSNSSIHLLVHICPRDWSHQIPHQDRGVRGHISVFLWNESWRPAGYLRASAVALHTHDFPAELYEGCLRCLGWELRHPTLTDAFMEAPRFMYSFVWAGSQPSWHHLL